MKCARNEACNYRHTGLGMARAAGTQEAQVLIDLPQRRYLNGEPISRATSAMYGLST